VTTIESIEPATETVRARFDPHSNADVNAAIAAADAAFRTWRAVPMAERAVRMELLARVLRDRADRYARLITTEMGKPITEAQAEIEKCAWTCDFYAEHAAAYLADEPVETNARASYVAFEPLGVILAVMPWNYPFWQVVRFLAPALMAGRTVKKAVLELGGSDPFIVLRDADLGAAAETAAKARFQNAGQSCIAAKRFLVEAPVAAEFERRFGDAIRALRVGDPLDPATQVGPLAREDLRDTLERQVAESIRMGARVVVGGTKRAGTGWFYEPTLLADVTEDMPVLKEETFGPVAALLAVRDADEAVGIANRSPYGLGAALWTANEAAARGIARRIESGSVFINGMVASDPRLPFGGVKKSGYGRELSSFGIREFVNIQTIWIGPAKPAAPVVNAE
jgi:acyl-CoA reductase-like NAD-dependent aldehyde dehydrogenase